MPSAMAAKAARATPTPIPAFAPVDSPFASDVFEGSDVGLDVWLEVGLDVAAEEMDDIDAGFWSLCVPFFSSHTPFPCWQHALFPVP